MHLLQLLNEFRASLQTQESGGARGGGGDGVNIGIYSPENQQRWKNECASGGKDLVIQLV